MKQMKQIANFSLKRRKHLMCFKIRISLKLKKMQQKQDCSYQGEVLKVPTAS